MKQLYSFMLTSLLAYSCNTSSPLQNQDSQKHSALKKDFETLYKNTSYMQETYDPTQKLQYNFIKDSSLVHILLDATALTLESKSYDSVASSVVNETLNALGDRIAFRRAVLESVDEL